MRVDIARGEMLRGVMEPHFGSFHVILAALPPVRQSFCRALSAAGVHGGRAGNGTVAAKAAAGISAASARPISHSR